MSRLRNIAAALPLALALLSAATAQTRHTTTDWDVQPSLKYDAICALNMLSGDPYYLAYYKADYERLSRQLKPEELATFTSLKHRIKDENGGIISAQLALYFSAVDADSLEDLIKVVEDSSTLKRNFQATTYFDENDWKIYEASRSDLKAAFRALQRIHFEADWEKEIRPRIDAARKKIAADLPNYNIVPAIETALGSPRPSNRITVYLLYYSEPHGIKITGTRFLTHYSYPFRIVLHNAIHEMMHPPYDLAHDPELRADLNSLRAVPYFMNKVEHHDRSFGYNEPDGLVEEDCVQALEEWIAARFVEAQDPREYWRQQDDGIHVFAVALYSIMKEQHFGDQSEPFPAFLKRMFKEGKFSSNQIEERNKVFFSAGTPPAAKRRKLQPTAQAVG